MQKEEMNKIEYKKYFEGKKITKQGFGFLGRGANVVKFLLESGATVIVTDMKSEKELEKSIKEVEEFIKENNIDRNRLIYRLGEHRLEDFVNCDYVIQASGVPKDNKFLLHAKENNIPVYQESSLFAEIVNNFNNNILEKSDEKKILRNPDAIKIIGVTGTRGKTTTTFLIKAIIENYLQKYNIQNNTDRKSYFGGNVQNVATLENLKNIKASDVIVMELDSWVLQGFADIKFSPHTAVFTTFMPDHMNYYKGNMDEYFRDKAAIFLNQKDGCKFVSTKNIKEDIYKYLEVSVIKNFCDIESSKLFLDNEKLKYYNEKYKTLLLGEHNKINMALAVRVCEEFMKEEDLDFEIIKKIIQETLDNFTGVAGRLEFVKEIDGVKYYNDTTSTTPDALMVALESFKNKNIILICGGRDKELDISEAAEKIINFKRSNILKEIILLSNDTTSGTEKFINIFKENNFVDFVEAKNIEEAVKEAALRAASEKEESKKTGEKTIVLFSPGFASFGMFLNEYDRGEKYLEEVNRI